MSKNSFKLGSNPLSKEQIRVVMGENIRKERISRNLAVDQLAKLLDITPGFMGLIERGQRGTNPSTLLKLSEIFETTIDTFFYGREGTELPVEINETEEQLRKQIASLIFDSDENELEFVIAAVKFCRKAMRQQTS